MWKKRTSRTRNGLGQQNHSKPSDQILLLTSTIDPKHGWGRYSIGMAQSLNDASSLYTLKKFNYSNNEILVRGVLIKKVFWIVYLFKYELAILREVKKYRKIHCLTEECIGQGLLLKLLGRKQLYITLHGTYAVVNFRNPLNALKLLMVLAVATKISTGSHLTFSIIPKIFQHKVEIIPNGVDLKNFYPTNSKRESRKHFIIVGALKRRKGADLVLKALKRMPLGTKLVIVGDQSNSNFFGSLKKFVEENDLNDYVNFYQNLSDPELRDLYSSAFALLLPARIDNNSFEGFPMVIFEANACGTPAICTKGFGGDDAIISGSTGLLINPEDVDDLHSAMLKILNEWDPETTSNACTARAKDFSWEAIRSRLLSLYT
jgi:glycosyltransferase involved in cell wall biosynthesis